MSRRDFERRIGRVTAIAERTAPDMLCSRVRQVCRTWRSYLAWRLAVALRDIGAVTP